MVAGPGLEPGALNRDNLRRDAQCGEGDAGGVGEFGKGGGGPRGVWQKTTLFPDFFSATFPNNGQYQC